MPARMGETTLRARLATRENALNFLRLVLAGLVIVSHTWSVAGFGAEPQFGDLNLGAWAVAGFFAISGYLVAGSRVRQGFVDYARRRVLRILPGFWVCLLVVAFGFAPLAAGLAGTPFDAARAARFAGANSTTVMLQQGIGDELRRVPYPDVWDASLWTLMHELACYVLVGVGLGWALVRQHIVEATSLVYVSLTVVNVVAATQGITRGTLPADFLRLAGYFAAGAMLWGLGERVRVSWPPVLVAVGVLCVLAGVGMVDVLGALPLAYLALAFGAVSPIRWGSRRDLSYGVYVYAWPIQQLLVLAGFAAFGAPVFIAATIALVLPMAWLSWTCVERPALRLGRTPERERHLPRAGVPDVAGPDRDGAR